MSNAMPYRPRPGTLPARVIDWLRYNPDEELTVDDVARKWDAYPSTAKIGLEGAVKAGALALVHNSDRQLVYRLPTATPTPTAVAQAIPFKPLTEAQKLEADFDAHIGTPSTTTMTQRNHSTAVRNLTTPKRGYISLPASTLDFSGLKVETGVPVLGKEKGRYNVSKWQPLLDMLTQPEQSIEIPVTWKSALAAHINKVNTQAKKDGKPDRFLARITGPDTARVWRLA